MISRLISWWMGVDVLWRVLAIVTIVLIFAGQCALCVKAKNRELTYLPLAYVVLAFVAAYFSITRDFLRMGRYICWLIGCYGAGCLAAILFARLLMWIFVLRKRPRQPGTGQPFWQNPAKRKIIVMSVAVVLCLAFALVIKWEVGYRRPYKDLERSDLIGIDIVFGGWDPQRLSEEETEAVLDILDDLVIYRKLLCQDPGEGWYTAQFVLCYADGRTEVISGSATGVRKNHPIRLIAKDVDALGDMCIDFVIYRSTLDAYELGELWAEYRKIYYGK